MGDLPNSLNSLEAKISSWTLADDSQLITLLEEYSGNLLNTCEALDRRLNDTLKRIKRLDSHVDNMNCCLKALANVKFVEQRIEDDSEYIKSRLVPQVEEKHEQSSKDLVHFALHQALNVVACNNTSTTESLPELPPLIGSSEFKALVERPSTSVELARQPTAVREETPEMDKRQNEPIRAYIAEEPETLPAILSVIPKQPQIKAENENVNQIVSDTRSIDKQSISSKSSSISSKEPKMVAAAINQTSSRKSNLFDESETEEEEEEPSTSTNTRSTLPPSSSPSPVIEQRAEAAEKSTKEEIIKRLPAGARAVLPMSNDAPIRPKEQLTGENAQHPKQNSAEPKESSSAPSTISNNSREYEKSKPTETKPTSITRPQTKQAAQVRSIFDSDSDEDDLFKSIAPVSSRTLPPIAKKVVPSLQPTVPVNSEAKNKTEESKTNHENSKQPTAASTTNDQTKRSSDASPHSSQTNQQRAAKYKSIFDDSDDEGDIFISKPKTASTYQKPKKEENSRETSTPKTEPASSQSVIEQRDKSKDQPSQRPAAKADFVEVTPEEGKNVSAQTSASVTSVEAEKVDVTAELFEAEVVKSTLVEEKKVETVQEPLAVEVPKTTPVKPLISPKPQLLKEVQAIKPKVSEANQAASQTKDEPKEDRYFENQRLPVAETLPKKENTESSTLQVERPPSPSKQSVQPSFEGEEPPALSLSEENEALLGDPKSVKQQLASKNKQTLKILPAVNSTTTNSEFNQDEPPPLTFSESEEEEEAATGETMPGKLNNAAFSNLLSSKLAMGPPPSGGRKPTASPSAEPEPSSRLGPSTSNPPPIFSANRDRNEPEPSGRDLLKGTPSTVTPKVEFVTKNRPKGPPRRPPSNLRAHTEEPDMPSSSMTSSSVNFRQSSTSTPRSLRPTSSAASIGTSSLSAKSPESTTPNLRPVSTLPSSTSIRPASTVGSSSERTSERIGISTEKNRLNAGNVQKKDDLLPARTGLPPRSTGSSVASTLGSTTSQRRKEEADLDELLASMDNFVKDDKDSTSQRKSSTSSLSGSESKQVSPRNTTATAIKSSPNSTRIVVSNDKSPSFLPPSASKTMPVSNLRKDPLKKSIFSSDSDDDSLFKPISKSSASTTKRPSQSSASSTSSNRMSQSIITKPPPPSSSAITNTTKPPTSSTNRMTSSATSASSRAKPKSLFDDSEDDDLDLFRKKK